MEIECTRKRGERGRKTPSISSNGISWSFLRENGIFIEIKYEWRNSQIQKLKWYEGHRKARKKENKMAYSLRE
jgi:hypothetical protein